MKNKRFLLLPVLALFVQASPLHSQHQSGQPVASEQKNNKYPETFTLTKSELDVLLGKKAQERVRLRKNKYLDKSQVVRNVSNGDMRLVHLRLNYFAKGSMTIQVNGTASTQIFIFSDDKTYFYKGRPDAAGFILTRCAEDEIVSE